MDMKNAFWQAREALSALYSPREAGLIAGQLLERVTGLTHTQRLTREQEPLREEAASRLQGYLRRLLGAEPLQYVLEEAWFFGLPLRVSPAVLIPRPETEELVSWVLDDAGTLTPGAAAPLIIDAGTGSGCIAIALKNNLPGARLLALDRSAAALNLARENGERLGLALEWREADILDPATWDALPPATVLVSNPPYIPDRERAGLQPQVAEHEPALALFVPDGDPLLFYRALGTLARRRLLPGGLLYTEIHEDRGKEVCALYRAQGLEEVILRQDMQGRDRMVRARQPGSP